MYDIAFLSRIIPPENEELIRSKMLGAMEDAAMAWQWHVINGVEANNDLPVNLINYLPVNSYPNAYKDPFIDKCYFSHVEGAQDVNLGYCNVKYIKRIVQWIPLYQEIKKWARNDSGNQKVLIAYTMYPEFMRAIRMVKSKFPDIITINIVVDMPQFTVLSKKKTNIISRLFSDWSNKQAYANIKSVDGFVTITKQMAEELSPNTPYRIVEGLCTTEFPQKIAVKDDIKNVIYAGKLYEKFGIITLLDAFEHVENDHIRLVICGMGEAEEEIKERAKQDHRIQFLGKLKREEVLQLLVDSDVIVNPRQNNGEYTKYSFPSKNIEALSSGVPFIGYKLDGIPDEYDSFINYPDDNSPGALAKLIEKICVNDAEIALAKAEKAKQWILQYKSCEGQGKCILDLIDSISSTASSNETV